MSVKVKIMNDSICPIGFSELDPKPSAILDREQIIKLVIKTAKFPCSFPITLSLDIFFCNHEAILLLADPP